MRILTLNLRAGGGPRVPALVEAVVEHRPDVAVLTEFRVGSTGTRLIELLALHGYAEVLHGSPPPRTNSVVIVSRVPMHPEAVPAPHYRVVGAGFNGLSIRGLYLPLDQPKVAFWDAHLAAAINAVSAAPSILIGDFNTGSSDERPATMRYAAEDRYLALLASGWVDSVRTRQVGAPEFSWFSHVGNGFTLDHVLMSPTVAHRLSAARIMHEPRLAGITDHSAVVVDLDW